MVVALFAAAAFSITVSDVHTDGDSLVPFAKMTVKYPELSKELFAKIETSDDSHVDESELPAALEAGTIAECAEYACSLVIGSASKDQSHGHELACLEKLTGGSRAVPRLQQSLLSLCSATG